jgi:uncharacterized protein (TIGR00156 family)
MKHRVSTFALVIAALFTAASPAAAQDYQPGRQPHATVAEIVALPAVNHPVVLTGYLVKKNGDEKYTFQDDTGSIQAEIPGEVLYNITVDGHRLTLRGTVDSDGPVAEVDVDSVTAAE